jgi:hypothetical protein
LARVFRVPDGEPVHTQLAHISGLSGGERLWFERGVVLAGTVLVEHEVLSDTPGWLAVPRLIRRFRCGAREAAGLAELFLALDAGPPIVAYYEAEARWRGAAAVAAELAHLVAQLALAEAVPPTDALEEAVPAGDAVETLATAGGAAQLAVQSEAPSTHFGWHALGTVQPCVVRCPACGAVGEDDADSPDLPVCLACGARDTWEVRQGPRFLALVGAIDGCPSLEVLGELGKRLYALGLPAEQARVAWSHYRLRKEALEAALPLGQPTQLLLGEIARAGRGFLPRFGGCLYRLQRAEVVSITPPEWRRVWGAYQARRQALAV